MAKREYLAEYLRMYSTDFQKIIRIGGHMDGDYKSNIYVAKP